MSEKMKYCKHCRTEISAKAKICPNCKKKQSSPLKIAGLIFVVFIILTIIGGSNSKDDKSTSQSASTKEQSSSSNDNVSKPNDESPVSEAAQSIETTESVETAPAEPEISEDEFKSLCQEFNYKDVLRNPSDYVGEKIKVTLKLSTVHESGILNPVKYYFGYTKGDYDLWYEDRYGVFDKRYDDSLKLLSEDIIEVYGVITDPEYTKSLIVNSEEVFCIDMYYVDLISE